MSEFVMEYEDEDVSIDTDIDSIDTELDEAEVMRAKLVKYTDKYFDRLDKANFYLNQLELLKEYTQKFGLDKHILFLANSNGELSKVLNMPLPSCESFYEVDPNQTIAALEGYDRATTRIFEGWLADLLKEFSAIRRFYQSVWDGMRKNENELNIINSGLSKVSLAGNKDSISCYDFKKVQEWVAFETKAHMRALNYLTGMQDLSLSEGTRDEIGKQTEELDNDDDTIDAFNLVRTSYELNRINKNDLKKYVDNAILLCKHTKRVNDDYNGYWMSGLRQGKLHSVSWLAGLIGVIASYYYRSYILQIARKSWRNMNQIVSMNTRIIKSALKFKRLI